MNYEMTKKFAGVVIEVKSEDRDVFFDLDNAIHDVLKKHGYEKA